MLLPRFARPVPFKHSIQARVRLIQFESTGRDTEVPGETLSAFRFVGVHLEAGDGVLGPVVQVDDLMYSALDPTNHLVRRS